MSHRLVNPKEVIYLSQEYAQGIYEPEHLISIRTETADKKMELFGWEVDRTSDVVVIKDHDSDRTATVTYVAVRSDISYAVNEEVADVIVKAALEARGEGIIVNCHYGQVRSYTVAKWIAANLGYSLSTHRWAVPEHRCTMDNGIYRALDAAHARLLANIAADQRKQALKHKG